ncbi:MAG: triose-phosphate isomerase [Alphaproteobacteria bacterium]|nr:triose-phosphate isomerase [Alphaproteobacteria bacterium]
MARPRPVVVGNWKMNGLRASLAELEAILAGIAQGPAPAAEAGLCPPATLLPIFAKAVGDRPLLLGGQDCHASASGAHTGDISAEMLADAGARLVIVGHSERRADHGEGDAQVRAKVEAAWRAGLTAIVCVGEREGERDAGTTLEVVSGQLEGSLPDGVTGGNTILAYEPVWAIGTGRTPTSAEIAEVHGAIRAALARRFAAGAAVRLLYGGSVKPGNAAEIFAIADVDGGLVGGASLKAADFVPILRAAG